MMPKTAFSITEYIRADIHRAEVEAAVRRALEAAINVVSGCDRVSEVQPAIRALAPAQFIGGGDD